MEWPSVGRQGGRVTDTLLSVRVCMTSLFILILVLRGFGDDKGHAAQSSRSHGGKGQIKNEPQQCATRPRNIALHLVH